MPLQRRGMFGRGVNAGQAARADALLASSPPPLGLSRWLTDPAGVGGAADRSLASAVGSVSKSLPTQVSFPDHSCDSVPITKDPEAQRRLLNALAASIRPGLPNGVEERAFWGADRLSGGYHLLPEFTDHRHDRVDVAPRQRATFEALLSGDYRDAYFFHTHPNGFDFAPISKDDRDVADKTQSVGIAIDRRGRVTCGRR